jgi:putative peptidoglycan lipid II flippase
VITVSVVTALLPALSRIAHAGDLSRVSRDLARTLRMVGAVIIPIAAVLLVIGSGLAVLLFGYGAATAQQASVTGQIVSVFMIGLLPFTLFYVLLRGYYALEDTKTPFWITVGFNAVLLAIAVPWSSRLDGGAAQVAVLALSYSLAYWVAFVVAWFLLGRRLGGLQTRSTAWALGRMAIAAGLSIVAMLATQVLLVQYVTGGGLENRWHVVLNVAVVGAVGLAGYLGAASLLRINEVREALRLLTRRRAHAR